MSHCHLRPRFTFLVEYVQFKNYLTGKVKRFVSKNVRLIKQTNKRIIWLTSFSIEKEYSLITLITKILTISRREFISSFKSLE